MISAGTARGFAAANAVRLARPLHPRLCGRTASGLGRRSPSPAAAAAGAVGVGARLPKLAQA